MGKVIALLVGLFVVGFVSRAESQTRPQEALKGIRAVTVSADVDALGAANGLDAEIVLRVHVEEDAGEGHERDEEEKFSLPGLQFCGLFHDV